MNFADSVKVNNAFQENTDNPNDKRGRIISGKISYSDFSDIMAHATADSMTEIDKDGTVSPMKLLLVAMISAEIVGRAWDLLVEEYGKDAEEE